MIDFLDTLHYCWSYLFLISFPAALIGFFILMHAKLDQPTNKAKLNMIGGTLFGQLFFVGLISLLLQGLVVSSIRSEFKTYINSPDLTVSINDKNFDTIFQKNLINALKEVRTFPSHHSGPLEKNKVTISNGVDSITVMIARDSRDSMEYWIFWNKYSMTRESEEVGRMNSKLQIVAPN